MTPENRQSKAIMKLSAAVLFFCTSLIAAVPGFADLSVKPFNEGEKLIFELRWTIIPAGEAVLEVLPEKIIDGSRAYHFVLTAKSNAFIDSFYKVRDRIDAFSDIDMTCSLLYKKKQLEGNTNRDVIVKFDREKMLAVYSNKGSTAEPIPIEKGSFDPLSVFYFSRCLNLEEGSEIVRHVTDGKKGVMGKAKVLRRERIKTPAGVFDTFVLEPDMKHVGGVFEKSKNARLQLWVTSDCRHIPVRIKSKVAVGSFVGELISKEGITDMTCN